MSGHKVAVIAGYGTGISAAVAQKLGDEGFRLALLSRTQARLDAAAEDLSKGGITAMGFATDLRDPQSVIAAIVRARAELGPITLLYWNPSGQGGGALSEASQAWSDNLAVTVVGLQAAVMEAHADLAAHRGGVLVTGGGLSLEREASVQFAVAHNLSSWAVAKAAQRKLVHILHTQLAPEGVFAGEVTVTGGVRGTPWDPDGTSAITPERVAQAAWDLYTTRAPGVWCTIL